MGLRNILHKSIYGILIFFICIWESGNAHGMVFSRDAELGSEELKARSKISDIITERRVYNEALADYLERHSKSSVEDKQRVLEEIRGKKVRYAHVNIEYNMYLEGVRKDQECYRLLDTDFMEPDIDAIYKAVSTILTTLDGYGITHNVKRELDEKYFFHEIKKLAKPYVTRDCKELCDRIKWVHGNEGSYLPLSIFEDTSKMLDHFRRRRGEQIKKVEGFATSNKDCSDKEAKELRRLINLLKGVTELLKDYHKVEVDYGAESDARRWFLLNVWGIEILRMIEASCDEGDDILKEIQKIDDAGVSSSLTPSITAKNKQKGRKRVSVASTSASASVVVVSESAIGPISVKADSSSTSEEEDIAEKDDTIIVQSQPLKRVKPKITRESYAEKRARQEANFDKYMKILEEAQPIENMVELEDFRVSQLGENAKEILGNFLEDKQFPYDRFETLIKRLRGYIKPTGNGSQHKVILFDANEYKHTVSIHSPHNGFTSLDPVSRSNVFFGLQSAGFIKWNR